MWVVHDRWISDPLHWANKRNRDREDGVTMQTIPVSPFFSTLSSRIVHLIIMQPSTFHLSYCFTRIIIVTIITSRKSQWVIRRKILIFHLMNLSRVESLNVLPLISCCWATVSQHRGLLCNSNVSPTWPHRICYANNGSNIYATFAVFSTIFRRLYDSNIDANILTIYNNQILTALDFYIFNTE